MVKTLLKTMLLLFVLMAGGTAWAATKTSTMTFNAACNGSGTADDEVNWTVTSDGTESNFDGTKGIHYGTSSSSVSYIQLNTSDITGTITKVIVNASTASGVTASLSVTVDGEAFGESKSLTTSADRYTFTGSASGEIIVRVAKPSKTKGALYLRTIIVTYDEASGLENCDLALTDAPVELSFDLYNNSAAQIINYTTSSTGAVSVAASDYATFSVDQTNKTITVTPTAVTPSAQTITVSQAADETYDAGSTTFTLTVSDSTPFAGGDVTFTAGTDLGSTTSNYSEDEVSKSGVTISSTDAAFATAEYRLYSGSKTTISTTTGKITKIVFTKTGSYNLSNLSTETGTYSNGTWTGNAESVEFAASAQVRLSTIVVTVSMNTKDPVATINSISPTSIATGADGEFTFDVTYTDGLSANDVTITWTSDDEDVLANISGSYLAGDEGTANVTVTVTPNSDEYEAVSKTFVVTVFAPVEFSEFYESFDDCDGDGGNDGAWGGINSQGNIDTEDEGWTFIKGNIADRCARFGTSNASGSAQTPALNLDPAVNYVLLFKAGPWTGASTTLTLNATDDVFNGQTSTTVTMVSGNWTGYYVELSNGSATTKITFASTGRFFLDEVRVMEKSEFEALSLNETVLSNGWKTYIPAYNVSFDEGVAYVVTAVDEATSSITIEGVTEVPAKTPLLLKGAGEKTITAITTDVTAPETNMLSIGNGMDATDEYPYVLAKDGNGACFKQWTGNAATLNGRVVLMLDFAQTSEARVLRFADDVTTGISNVNVETTANNRYFDLQGRNVMLPTKGLYIVDGKKVLVK